MKEEILITLFGGGTADYEMLEECNYSFEDILSKMLERTPLESADFNDILTGAVDVFRSNIDEVIKSKIYVLETDILWSAELPAKELKRIQKDLDDLKRMNPFRDIEFFANYLDNHIWISEDMKESYKRLLSDEIEAENEKLGFVYLDLDED